MKKLYVLIIGLIIPFFSSAQVKYNYLYSTSTPYGTLDIRTNISSSDYFYLQENKTFAFRESSPGVRTNTYLDMTSTWDSSPYKQGNLRRKTGTTDKFVMNYRLLFPNNYTTTYTQGYPLIILFHGAGERANCLYNNCYHSGWNWDPNVNSPAAPTSPTSKLLNNDHNLFNGGKTHLDARNLAGTRLPNDPSMPGRAFPGFVVVPQMLNVWDSVNVQDAIRMVQLLVKKYKIDPNRIYVHGLSIGGHAVWQAVKRAPWLFAAALPMSASHDAGIIKQNQVGKIGHIPYWIFQGGKDVKPTPAYTTNIVNYLRNGGANVKYSLYADLGHTCFHKAYAEPEFFKFMLSKNKANIHVYKSNTVISGTTYPKLILPEGFYAYQWEKNGVIITGATSFTYTANTPGKYRARFSRFANPTSTQWNIWSAPVTITTSTSTTTARMATADESEEVEIVSDETFQVDVYPNPTTANELNVVANGKMDETIQIQVVDHLGREAHRSVIEPEKFNAVSRVELPRDLLPGVYMVIATQGRTRLRQRIVIRN